MMRTSGTAVSLIACAALLLPLAGCSDEPQSRPSAPPVAAKPAAAPDTRYEATLAEGIDFARPGYPYFLKEVQGVSGHEAWGRWTDANLAPSAKLRFVKPLPKNFTLELQASGLGPNAFRPVRIRVGAVEKSITLGNPPQESYRIAFSDTGGADLIEIIPPAPILPREVNPQNPDPRKLGVGLKSIKILD